MQNILDFEKQTSVSVTAIVENKDGGKLVEVFEVNIENENEAPKVRTWDLAVQQSWPLQALTKIPFPSSIKYLQAWLC